MIDMNRFIIILLSLFACVANAQEAIERELPWDYPAKPGMEEWNSFQTGQERLKACQIPQEILDIMSTKDLAEICMNYPLYGDFIFFNIERSVISSLIGSFNGLKELSVRKDGVRALINIYRDYPVLFDLQHDVSSKDYDTPYRLPFLELLLSSKLFVKQLDEQQAVELGKIVLNKYNRKRENSHVYNSWNIQHTFLLGAALIEQHGLSSKSAEQSDAISRYIENYRNPDPSLLTEISQIISEL